jgi:hypothetical protein
MISRGHLFLGLGLMAVLALVVLMAISVLAGSGGALATVVEAAGDDDRPISGEASDKCIAAALVEYPGGTVTETEADNDGAPYEVEVRLEDGSQVEVNLNRDCQVIGQEADDDGPNDD